MQRIPAIPCLKEQPALFLRWLSGHRRTEPKLAHLQDVADVGASLDLCPSVTQAHSPVKTYLLYALFRNCR